MVRAAKVSGMKIWVTPMARRMERCTSSMARAAMIGHRGHTALSEGCISLVEGCFTNERHATLGRYFQRETHAGYTRANHEEIIIVCHCNVFSTAKVHTFSQTTK